MLRSFVAATITVFFLLFSGCDVLGWSSSGSDFSTTYTTERSQYAVTDTVTATFENQEQNAVYVFQGCPTVGLQQRVDQVWTPRPIPIFCFAILRPPISVAPGERFETGLLPYMLEEAEAEPGTYRLTLEIGLKESGPFRTVVSNRFELTEQ